MSTISNTPLCELVNGVARGIDGLMKAAVAFDRARGATWEESAPGWG